MDFPMRVVDLVSPAQGIETVALPRMRFARELERIEHRAIIFDTSPGRAQHVEFRVDETDVERCVVNDKFRSPNKLDEIRRNLRKLGFVPQVFERDAVYLDCAGVDLAPGIQVSLKTCITDSSIDDLDAAYFNDSMTL